MPRQLKALTGDCATYRWARDNIRNGMWTRCRREITILSLAALTKRTKPSHEPAGTRRARRLGHLRIVWFRCDKGCAPAAEVVGRRRDR